MNTDDLDDNFFSLFILRLFFSIISEQLQKFRLSKHQKLTLMKMINMRKLRYRVLDIIHRINIYKMILHIMKI